MVMIHHIKCIVVKVQRDVSALALLHQNVHEPHLLEFVVGLRNIHFANLVLIDPHEVINVRQGPLHRGKLRCRRKVLSVMGIL